MLILAEFVIILVLLTALVALVLEEHKARKSKIPEATVKEYWSGEERRSSIRVSASLVVRYSVGDGKDLRFQGRMKNISSDGMRLLANEKLSHGTILLLEFDLPDIRRLISAQGKVVWADGKFDDRDRWGRRVFNTGIQFVGIKPQDRESLVGYIEKISKE